jgi:hypothetical protein
VEELDHFGLSTINDLEKVVTPRLPAAADYEASNPPGRGGRYTNIGIVRMATALASEAYRKHHYGAVDDFDRFL